MPRSPRGARPARAARRSSRGAGGWLSVPAGLGLILGLLALDHWIFTGWFGLSHLRWYLSIGAGVGLVTSVAAMAWGDMDRHVGLITAHPLGYLGACLQLVGLPLYALGTQLRSPGDASPRASSIDGLLAIPLVVILVAGMLLWLVVIAPPQYFVYLLCGAPARVLRRSERHPIARLQGSRLAVDEIGRGVQIPEGWWNIGIGEKPVSVTNLFASLVLLAVRPLAG